MDNMVRELVGCYRTATGAVNPWFTRRLKDQPEDVQEQVWAALREQGEVEDDWLSDGEWDWLAEQMIALIGKRAHMTYVQIANELMANREPPLKKRITMRNIQPLMDRMVAHRERYRAALAEALSRPTRMEVLATLSDFDVMTHFGHRLIEMIMTSLHGCPHCPHKTAPESDDALIEGRIDGETLDRVA